MSGKYQRCKQYEEPKQDCGLPDRSFSITEDDDGTCDIRLRLPGEECVSIHQAVEGMVDETRAGEANAPRPDNKNVSAETFLKSEMRSIQIYSVYRHLTCSGKHPSIVTCQLDRLAMSNQEFN